MTGEAEAIDLSVEKAAIAQKKWQEKQQEKQREKQQDYDKAAFAVAWALMKPQNNRLLAEIAVATTGFGNVADKIVKNHRKTLGLLRDLKNVKTCGIIKNDEINGITEIAQPKGVIACITPSTNPLATPANNIINALKCGNAVIISPSPKGEESCQKLLGFIHEQFDKCDVDKDLVQMVPPPASKDKTKMLMQKVDLVIVTGSQSNARMANQSNTPALAVGVGNVPVIIDETADIQQAVHKIAMSKIFDNATSCSSENSVIVVREVRQKIIDEFKKKGGELIDDEERKKFIQNHWHQGKLNRNMLAKDIGVLLDILKLDRLKNNKTKFLITEEQEVGSENPISSEKMALVLGLYTVSDFQAAKNLAKRILQHQGAGHSVGLHSQRQNRPLELAHQMPACRVIVNQPHCFATGGSFENGLPFSLSMGCGSWGKNVIDENLHWKHFLNITKIVRPIKARQPKIEDIFAQYWQKYGK